MGFFERTPVRHIRQFNTKNQDSDFASFFFFYAKAELVMVKQLVIQ